MTNKDLVVLGVLTTVAGDHDTVTDHGSPALDWKQMDSIVLNDSHAMQFRYYSGTPKCGHFWNQ